MNGIVVWPWSQCVKSCFIINCQLLPPSTSGPWLQKWTSSTLVPSPMWNPDTGADTKCLAMEPMCQIMFYNHLPTSETIHKQTLSLEVGRFHIGALTDVEPGHGANTKYPAMEPMCQIMFYNQLPTCANIHKWTLDHVL